MVLCGFHPSDDACALRTQGCEQNRRLQHRPRHLRITFRPWPYLPVKNALLNGCVRILVLSRIMKLSHAAALALVGWYLMLPPYVPYHPGGPLPDPDTGPWDHKAPISQWQITRSYDTAAECTVALNMKKKQTDKAKQDAENSLSHNRSMTSDERRSREEVIRWAYALQLASVCIASDDPRLAK
jgi:hypothetical protein